MNCSSTVTIDNWNVENYGKANYGTKTIAGAFAVSSNTGFARLIDTIGTDKVVDMAKRCGIDTELESVPSITLGSQGVTVREMAEAYATIATGGIHREAVAIENIKDKDGNVIFEANTEGERVLEEDVAKATEQVMEGVVTGGTGTAAALYTGQEVAGKTGTSEQWRDSWFCGITPQYSVAIWLGARQEKTMPESFTATSVFSSFVGSLLQGQPIEQFPMENALAPHYRTLTTEEYTKLGGGSVTNQNYYYYDATTTTTDDDDDDLDDGTTTGEDDPYGNGDDDGTGEDGNGNGYGDGGDGGDNGAGGNSTTTGEMY